jgi:hypothetical protein
MDRPKLKWYSIDDVKPADGQRVLIADDFADDVTMATYMKRGSWQLNSGAEIPTKPYPYWTNLPEHPQKFGGIVGVIDV